MSLPSKRKECTAAANLPPRELRDLARLELKRRRLLRDVAEVLDQERQLSREIELRGIPIPWLTPVRSRSDKIR